MNRQNLKEYTLSLINSLKNKSDVPTETKIISKKNLNEEVISFILKNPFEEMITPFQYVFLTIPGFFEKMFFVSDSDESMIEIAIFEDDNFKKRIINMDVKSKIYIRGPFGNTNILNQLKKDDTIIICENKNLVKFKPFIKFVDKNRDDFKKLDIFLQFNNEKEIIYKDELKNLENRFDIKYFIKKKNKKDTKSIAGNIVDHLKSNQDMIKDNKKALILSQEYEEKKYTDLLLSKGIEQKNIFLLNRTKIVCGHGKCGKCMQKGIYICKDGPFFSLSANRSFDEKKNG